MSVHVVQVQNEDRSFTLRAEQEVPVSVEEFDRVVGRPREMGRWFDINFTWPTCPDRQLEVGSAIEFKAPVGPVSTEFTLLVADRVPGRSMLLRTTRGTVDITFEYIWESSAVGTHVSVRVDVRVRGAQWWRGPWARTMAGRRLARGLERMQRDLEQTPQDDARVPAAAPTASRAVHRAAPRRICAQRA